MTSPELSEQHYRRLFEAAHDGILLVDPDTRCITDANPFLMEFLGYSHAELVGKELFEIGLLKDEAASQAAFFELKTKGHIRYENLPLETREGKRAEVEFISHLYEDGSTWVIQCNIRDITDRKKRENIAEAKLLQHAAEMETMVALRTTELRISNGQLETFVNSVAHDLRSPLRLMRGFSELLVEETKSGLSEQAKNYAIYINTAAGTMDRLIVDLLSFSRISQQKIALEPVALEATIRDAITDCEPEILASHARVEATPPFPAVEAHEGTLRQVFINLISNAVKFVANKPPLVRIHAEERPGKMIRIWVEDNGIGIDKEFHELVFKIFQRLHRVDAYEGTGIGLSIVQTGVTRMSGRVGVESELGKGSRFWIELPRAQLSRVAKPEAILLLQSAFSVSER